MPGKTSLIPESVYSRYTSEKLRIGVLHAGGPAPGGNQVLYAAALRAKDHGLPLLAFRNGYNHLMNDSIEVLKEKWIMDIGSEEIRYLRDQRSLLPGSARANPGKTILSLADLDDLKKTAGLTRVLEVLESLKIGALISVGGDDTMRTANLLQIHLKNLEAAGKRFYFFKGVVHVPKTIDKDYPGIDFTFGFMSAAQFIGDRVRSLHDDSKATASESMFVYHIAEIMGRAAGWLCGAASIYGQATYAIVPEDYTGKKGLTLEHLVNQCVDVIMTRHHQGKNYGVISVAAGLGDMVDLGREVEKDEFGHTRLDTIELAAMLKHGIKKELAKRANIKVKVHSHTLGYDARQVQPNMFDTLLCQRLGVSAVDAIIREQFGNMISCTGVFNPKLVPFSELVDPETLKVENWVMSPDEGLYGLMKAMQQPYADVDVDKL
jgi:ATP-dependent phosphofructokinase / diphosphate-dependent phosphofructokinase